MGSEDDDVWQALVSSIVSGPYNQNEDLLSPEDFAWVDSCLVNEPELSDSGWHALKDALLDIISSEPTLSYNAPTNENNGLAEGTDNDLVEMEMGEEVGITGGSDDSLLAVSVEAEKAKFLRDMGENSSSNQMTEMAETGQFSSYLQSDLPNFRIKRKDKDTDSGSSSGVSNERELSSENIFRVWDLDTSVLEEDDVFKQLETALAESSLEDLPSTLDYSVPDMDNEKLDNLIANMADLSLNSS